MGLIKTMSQSSAELKDILDRLTALESGETFATKEMFESLKEGMNDIFSCRVNIANESNIAIDKEEIINQFNMPDNIDLSQYKAVFYIVDDENISFDSKLFRVNLVLGGDSVWKLNVVNQTSFAFTFTIFIVKKDSDYAYLFDVIDSIILKAYTNMIIYSGMTTISSGGNYLMPVEISTAISPYSCTQCEIVSITSNSGVVDGARAYFMSSDVTASVKKVNNPINETQKQYKVEVHNNASTALTTNTFVLVSFVMSRGGTV